MSYYIVSDEEQSVVYVPGMIFYVNLVSFLGFLSVRRKTKYKGNFAGIPECRTVH